MNYSPHAGICFVQLRPIQTDLRGVFGQDGWNYSQMKEWNRKTDATGANLDVIALF